VTEVIDGRRLRRAQNRSAVLDALLGLFADGVYDPSSAEIAERAGLSPRSLFRYFDDIDDLHRAAVEANLALARPLVAVTVDAAEPTDAKVRAIVDGRMRLYSTIAPGARAARILAARHKIIATQLAQNRVFLREQVARLFAPELSVMPEPSRSAALSVVDVLCSFESWDLLVAEQGLAAPAVNRALVSGLTAVLGGVTTGGKN